MSAAVEICIAAAFSAAMRRYSAALQEPLAIIRVRRKIVSHDATVRRAIIIGRAKDVGRACFLMAYQMRLTGPATSGALGTPVACPEVIASGIQPVKPFATSNKAA